MEEMIGEVVGRYRIEAHIGEGGMAAVYRAYDERLDRQVAIKFIRFSGSTESISSETLKRFEREARALAKLSHPNIVKVYDYGEHNGYPYLVMEYLMGGTLRQRTGYPMNYREAAKLLLPIARALDYAHRQGVIHRDVKPSNILLTESGEPMLSDFGIAKLIYNKETISLTGEGVSVGTPEYIAPEQSVGAELDQRADIYSLGVIFYELITGRKPYTAETPVAVMVKHVVEPLPHPRAYVPDIPEEVEAVVIKTLAKKPQDRYSTMADFAQVLESLLRAPSADEVEPRLKADMQQPTQPNDVQVVKSKVQDYESTIDNYLSQWGEKPSTADHLTPPAGKPGMGAERKTPPSHPAFTPPQPAEAAVGEKARAWLPLGALAFGVIAAILLIGGSLLWLLRPQPQPQQLTALPASQEITSAAQIETATLHPLDTATHSPARVEAMTLIAEKTSVEKTAEQPEEDSKTPYLLFGPANGRLVHQTSSDGCLPNTRCAPLQQSAGVKARDFIAQATFYNPYPIKQGIWDIGFFFRSKSPEEGYRLIVRADSRWELREKSPNDDYVVASGKLPANTLDDTSGRTNQLKLLVYQKQGYLVVNDRNIVTLNLSLIEEAGDVILQSGYFENSQQQGQATRFEGFTVWSLPAPLQMEEKTLTYPAAGEEMVRLQQDGKWDNFIVRFAFSVPYPAYVAPWEVGLAFRSVSEDEEFRLTVASSTAWELAQKKPNIVQPTVLIQGKASGLMSIKEGESNEVFIFAQKDKGFFYMNGQLVKVLDLSSHQRAGAIAAVLGFHKNSGLAGKTVLIHSLDVVALPQIEEQQQVMLAATQSAEQLVQQQTATPTQAPSQAELIPPKKIEVEPSGSLSHQNKDVPLTVPLSATVKDFSIEATFYNPYATPLGTWDIGFYFRDNGDHRYWLIVRADASWQLIEQLQSETKVIDNQEKQKRKMVNLDNTKDKPNKLQLIVLNERGFLFVNDNFGATFEVSRWQEPGDLGLVVGYHPGSQKEGYTTRYEGLSVWEIGQPGVGPMEGEFVHDDEEKVKERFAGVQTKNFITSVIVENPYPATRGNWDAGIAFRSAGLDDQYQVLITSGPKGSYWYFGNRQPNLKATSWLAQGPLPGTVKMGYPAENKLYLFALREKGWFFVNDSLIAALDLFNRQTPGDIAVGNGFLNNTEISGEFTRYREFTVWDLPR